MTISLMSLAVLLGLVVLAFIVFAAGVATWVLKLLVVLAIVLWVLDSIGISGPRRVG